MTRLFVVAAFVLSVGTMAACGGGGSKSGASANISESPTLTSPAMTERGVILGTASYMSPEQARGKPVNKRSDVWVFGAGRGVSSYGYEPEAAGRLQGCDSCGERVGGFPD